MKISKKEVSHIAGLSRLKLNEKEKESFAGELSSILDYIEKLKKIDIDDEELIYQATKTKNRDRSDEVQNFEEKDKIIKQAPKKSGDFIEINKVF